MARFCPPSPPKEISSGTASLILGFIIAIWHLPIDISNDTLPAIGAVFIRIAWSLPLAIIFTWFYLKTGGSLLIAIIFHTAINILPDIGFSFYEQTIIILTIPLIFISLIVSSNLHMHSQLITPDDKNDK